MYHGLYNVLKMSLLLSNFFSGSKRLIVGIRLEETQKSFAKIFRINIFLVLFVNGNKDVK